MAEILYLVSALLITVTTVETLLTSTPLIIWPLFIQVRRKSQSVDPLIKTFCDPLVIKLTGFQCSYKQLGQFKPVLIVISFCLKELPLKCDICIRFCSILQNFYSCLIVSHIQINIRILLLYANRFTSSNKTIMIRTICHLFMEIRYFRVIDHSGEWRLIL